MLTKAFDIRYKRDEEISANEFVAYASTFDRVPDSAGDVVAPGAFTESLEEWKASGHPIPLLFGHRVDDPMMNIGAIIDAEEDERGLRVHARFDEQSEIAQYTRKLVLEGRLTKLSFAYDVLDAETITLDDGTRANELRKLKIYEISLVPIPANDMTEVIDAKAMTAEDNEQGKETNEEQVEEQVDTPDEMDEQGEEQADEPGEKAIDPGELRDMLVALQTVADRIAEMLDDILDELAIALYGNDDNTDDTGADDGKGDDDAQDDNAEDPDEDNAEVNQKAIDACLAKMAKYIEHSKEEANEC